MSLINQNFGDKVRRIRKSQKLSQEELASKSKLDITSINEIENGTRNPMLKTIQKIARALRIPTKELFDD